MSEFLDVSKFDIEKVLPKMRETGAVSLPLLKEAGRKQLERAALEAVPKVCPEMAPLNLQEGDIPIFDSYQAELGDLVRTVFSRDNYLPPYFYFNHLQLRTYPFLSSLEAHTDGPSRTGVIAVSILRGRGNSYALPLEFSFSEYGLRKIKLSSKPGDVIFMRANGFNREKREVPHSVGYVTSRRRDVLVSRHEGPLWLEQAA